jgi:RND family efflux transporter MFP subunit
VVTVKTIPATLKQFEYLIQSNGKIKAQNDQVITSEIDGRILMCKAQPSQQVHTGETVIQLETDPIKYRLQKATHNRFNLEREYESQLLGYENLLKEKSAMVADTIRQKLKISSGLAGAIQEIEETNYELSRATITAPFTGILADVKVQKGQLVKAGEPLFRLYDPANMLLEIKLLESDIKLIRRGLTAQIISLSDTSLKHTGTVHNINPYVDDNGMVAVTLSISGRPRSAALPALFPGMNCLAVIRIPLAKVLVLPKEAVINRDGKSVVFTMADGKAQWNYVTVGRENGTEIEIKSGLNPNQKVIVTNNLQLAHETPVKEEPK